MDVRSKRQGSNVGIADYKVKAGDTIKFYYVDDYTKDDTPTIDVSGDTHTKKLSPVTVKVAKDSLQYS